ncbi:MAG: hypothetical protein KDK76_06850, partial [Chlamydiia bacterium]|nr:hypothetical protein [Chlamydiia bacterium]
IPLVVQNLGISQSQRLRFDPIEAASYPRDRSDADRVKDQDADTGKNKVLNHERYNLDFFFDNCEIK